MKRYLPFIIVIVVALLTVGTGAMLYRAKRLPAPKLSQDQSASAMNSKGSIHVRGNPDALVTLEEFGDFQCPPCALLAAPIRQIEHDFQPHLRVIFHHFPLGNHQHAREAAWAAEAAHLQGRFWEMHDLLYREQSLWSKAAEVRTWFNAYAGMLGLNVERFKNDMESEKVKERVALDQEHAAKLGVQNTPTIFINNQAVDPTSLNPDKLREAVDTAIKAKPSS